MEHPFRAVANVEKPSQASLLAIPQKRIHQLSDCEYVSVGLQPGKLPLDYFAQIHVQEFLGVRFFAPLLAWVLSWWQGTQLAIALDATTLGDRFVALAISVVYRGCAIPVAWVVLEAGEKKAWRREWLGMLRQLRAAVPRGWTMMVLADRGLYGRWLFRRIIRLGWHPFLRINNGGTFWPEGSSLYRPLLSLVSEMGTEWSGRGTAFKGRGRQLDCTLLARWDTGHQDPWLILTDLPPEASDAAWYGLRAWIERGFKVTKREGWQWQQTRMSDPGRASRLRLVSVFRRGWIKLIIALIRHEPLPQGRFVPEPWLRSPEAEEEEVIEATECWTRPPNL